MPCRCTARDKPDTSMRIQCDVAKSDATYASTLLTRSLEASADLGLSHLSVFLRSLRCSSLKSRCTEFVGQTCATGTNNRKSPATASSCIHIEHDDDRLPCFLTTNTTLLNYAHCPLPLLVTWALHHKIASRICHIIIQFKRPCIFFFSRQPWLHA